MLQVLYIIITLKYLQGVKMQLKYYAVSLCASLALIGCGSSDSSSTTPATTNPSTSVYGSLNMSVPANGNVFAADANETTINTYTFTGISQNSTLSAATTSNNYSVNVSGLGTAMSVVSNSCQNVPSGSSCLISIQFAPTQQKEQYSQNLTLSFTSNNPLINSQTLNVSTVPSTLEVATDYYDTQKTSLMMSVANANPAVAEIDTGSQITVIDFNVTKQSDYQNGDINVSSADINCSKKIMELSRNNQLNTDENLSASPYNCMVMPYDYGNRSVYGFRANGSVSITAIDGTKIKTSPNTPLFISNNVNNKNGSGSTNSIIMGVGMNNQVSAKNYMPYPYNTMMMVDRSNKKITFGNFSAQKLSLYNFVELPPMPQSNCLNTLNFDNLQPTDTNLTCWNTQAAPVMFTVKDGNSTGASMPSLLDSGANNFTLQYIVLPSWVPYDSKTKTAYITGAYLQTTNGKKITIQLPSPAVVADSSASKVNVGNIVFQHNKVLYNQLNGALGLLPNKN